MTSRCWRLSDPAGDFVLMPRDDLELSGLHAKRGLLQSPAAARALMQINQWLGGARGDSRERAAEDSRRGRRAPRSGA